MRKIQRYEPGASLYQFLAGSRRHLPTGTAILHHLVSHFLLADTARRGRREHTPESISHHLVQKVAGKVMDSLLVDNMADGQVVSVGGVAGAEDTVHDVLRDLVRLWGSVKVIFRVQIEVTVYFRY